MQTLLNRGKPFLQRGHKVERTSILLLTAKNYRRHVVRWVICDSDSQLLLFFYLQPRVLYDFSTSLKTIRDLFP